MGDEAVQSTNDDATLCKLSAVRLGYWEDHFIGELSRQQGRERRAGKVQTTPPPPLARNLKYTN